MSPTELLNQISQDVANMPQRVLASLVEAPAGGAAAHLPASMPNPSPIGSSQHIGQTLNDVWQQMHPLAAAKTESFGAFERRHGISEMVKNVDLPAHKSGGEVLPAWPPLTAIQQKADFDKIEDIRDIYKASPPPQLPNLPRSNPQSLPNSGVFQSQSGVPFGGSSNADIKEVVRLLTKIEQDSDDILEAVLEMNTDRKKEHTQGSPSPFGQRSKDDKLGIARDLVGQLARGASPAHGTKISMGVLARSAASLIAKL